MGWRWFESSRGPSFIFINLVFSNFKKVIVTFKFDFFNAENLLFLLQSSIMVSFYFYVFGNFILIFLTEYEEAIMFVTRMGGMKATAEVPNMEMRC